MLVLLIVSACQSQPAVPRAPLPETVPYTFDAPARVFELPDELDEISGLTVYDDAHLAAVQDEDGQFYLLSIETGEVVRVVKFGKDGDYEGIERVGDRLWVLESDGTLYEVDAEAGDEADARRHKTALSSRYDTEGLVYDAAQHRLLIACKEYPGKKRKGQKTIYAFDLEKQDLLDNPVFSISTDAVEAYLEDHALNDAVRDGLEPVADAGRFKPSALAVHPQTQHLYVLSSVRKALIVLDAEGSLVAVTSLPASLFAQPEGMAFLPDGDLFISSEARGGTATLLRFAYRPQ